MWLGHILHPFNVTSIMTAFRAAGPVFTQASCSRLAHGRAVAVPAAGARTDTERRCRGSGTPHPAWRPGTAALPSEEPRGHSRPGLPPQRAGAG